MATEGQEKCASAGIVLGQELHSIQPGAVTPIIYPINLLARKEDLQVPHSELAMHVGAAGKDLIAFAMTHNTAYAVVDDGKGGCQFLHGLNHEVMTPALVDKLKKMFPHVEEWRKQYEKIHQTYIEGGGYVAPTEEECNGRLGKSR